MEYKSRRRHVPAFGEWNYYSSSSSPEEPQPPHFGGAAAAPGDYTASWSWTWYAPAEPEACSDAWFRYSPPPRDRPPAPKKARTPAGQKPPCYNDEGDGNGSVLPATEARARTVSDAMAAPAAKGAARRVVRPVDADLYRVPPPPQDDTAYRRPRRKRAARSLWMGCLGGFNCVA